MSNVRLKLRNAVCVKCDEKMRYRSSNEIRSACRWKSTCKDSQLHFQQLECTEYGVLSVSTTIPRIPSTVDNALSSRSYSSKHGSTLLQNVSNKIHSTWILNSVIHDDKKNLPPFFHFAVTVGQYSWIFQQNQWTMIVKEAESLQKKAESVCLEYLEARQCDPMFNVAAKSVRIEMWP